MITGSQQATMSNSYNKIHTYYDMAQDFIKSLSTIPDIKDDADKLKYEIEHFKDNSKMSID